MCRVISSRRGGNNDRDERAEGQRSPERRDGHRSPTASPETSALLHRGSVAYHQSNHERVIAQAGPVPVLPYICNCLGGERSPVMDLTTAYRYNASMMEYYSCKTRSHSLENLDSTPYRPRLPVIRSCPTPNASYSRFVSQASLRLLPFTLTPFNFNLFVSKQAKLKI